LRGKRCDRERGYDLIGVNEANTRGGVAAVDRVRDGQGDVVGTTYCVGVAWVLEVRVDDAVVIEVPLPKNDAIWITREGVVREVDRERCCARGRCGCGDSCEDAIPAGARSDCINPAAADAAGQAGEASCATCCRATVVRNGVANVTLVTATVELVCDAEDGRRIRSCTAGVGVVSGEVSRWYSGPVTNDQQGVAGYDLHWRVDNRDGAGATRVKPHIDSVDLDQEARSVTN